MKNTMSDLRNLVPATIRRLGLLKNFNSQVIMMRWAEIVGVENAAHCRAVSLQRGVVSVEVDSSVWAHHLSMMKTEMIDKANKIAGEKLVEDIRFKAGYLKKSQNYQQDEALIKNEARTALWQVHLSEAEKSWLEETVRNTANPELRRKMTRILRKELALRKQRHEQKWQQCQHCTALCPPEEKLCHTCATQKSEEQVIKTLQLLKAIPWLRFESAAAECGCKLEEYKAARDILLARLANALYQGDQDIMTVSSYLMLKTGAKPDKISEGAIKKVLDGFRRKKKNVSTPGSGHGNSIKGSHSHQ